MQGNMETKKLTKAQGPKRERVESKTGAKSKVLVPEIRQNQIWRHSQKQLDAQ